MEIDRQKIRGVAYNLETIGRSVRHELDNDFNVDDLMWFEERVLNEIKIVTNELANIFGVDIPSERI